MRTSILALLFGEFTVHIITSQDLLFKLADIMKEYRIESICQSEPSARIEIVDCCAFRDYQLGWSYRKVGLEYSVAYCNVRSKLFHLRYIEKKCSAILLYANTSILMHVVLGIHYGVMLALSKQCIGLHGVTIICGNKAIILSAPSGTGKTTLAKLLQKHCEAVIVNGDFALLSYSPENGVVFEPTPFCGSSKACHNYRLPISHIVFLEQAKQPHLSRLTAREALRLMLSNSFVPRWDESIQNDVQTTAMQIVGSIPISRFCLPPTEEAAHMLFSYINL